MSDTELHFAVVVGINRYPGLSDLNGARGDAEAFVEWLGEHGGVAEENIHLVIAEDTEMPAGIDRLDAKPRRGHIYSALREFRDRMDEIADDDPDRWERSRLYFYVSGHGFAPNPRDAALLAADAGSDEYENVSCVALLDYFLEHQSFKEILVFADCCRDRVPNTPLGVPPWQVSAITLGSVVPVFGCAAEYTQSAYEDGANPDDFRGFYTKALIEGLDGEAANSRREIDIESLARYVKFRVRKLTRDKPAPQVARMWNDAGFPVVLRPADEVPEDAGWHTVTLTAETPPEQPLAIFQTSDAIDEHDFSDGAPWEIRLLNGNYQVRRADGEVEPGLDGDGYFTVIGEDERVEL